MKAEEIAVQGANEVEAQDADRVKKKFAFENEAEWLKKYWFLVTAAVTFASWMFKVLHAAYYKRYLVYFNVSVTLLPKEKLFSLVSFLEYVGYATIYVFINLIAYIWIFDSKGKKEKIFKQLDLFVYTPIFTSVVSIIALIERNGIKRGLVAFFVLLQVLFAAALLYNLIKGIFLRTISKIETGVMIFCGINGIVFIGLRIAGNETIQANVNELLQTSGIYSTIYLFTCFFFWGELLLFLRNLFPSKTESGKIEKQQSLKPRKQILYELFIDTGCLALMIAVPVWTASMFGNTHAKNQKNFPIISYQHLDLPASFASMSDYQGIVIFETETSFVVKPGKITEEDGKKTLMFQDLQDETFQTLTKYFIEIPRTDVLYEKTTFAQVVS